MSARFRTLVCAMTTAAFLTACESTTAPPGETIAVCDVHGGMGSIIPIRSSQLTDYLKRGDYPTTLLVSKTNATVGDSIHFSRIGDALAVARAGRLGAQKRRPRRAESPSASTPASIKAPTMEPISPLSTSGPSSSMSH